MTTTIIFDEVQCCVCGVYFGIEHGYHQILLESGPDKTFFCPNGCSQHYNEKTPPPDPGPKVISLKDKENKVVDFIPKK